MIKNNFSLPYPALGLQGDFKEGEFSVIPKIYSADDELHIKEEEINITNTYLADLFMDGRVTTAYKIVCPSTLYSRTEVNDKHIIISLNEIVNYLDLEVFLVAVEDIDNYTDESFNDDYFLGENNGVFQIKKGYILGYAGNKKIPLKEIYTKGASGIFKFSRHEQDQPLSFDTDDNRISVMYPHKEGELDITKALPNKYRLTFLNLIIIPALREAFGELQKAFEEDRHDDLINNYDWAYILSEGMPEYTYISPCESAQKFMAKLLHQEGGEIVMPVLDAFLKELK